MRAAPMARGSDDQDWRLQFETGEKTDPDELREELRRSIAEDVVLTHDDSRFFLYAKTQDALRSARDAVELATPERRLAAPLRISHWDDALGIWRQVDPPITDEPVPRSWHPRCLFVGVEGLLWERRNRGRDQPCDDVSRLEMGAV